MYVRIYAHGLYVLYVIVICFVGFVFVLSACLSARSRPRPLAQAEANVPGRGQGQRPKAEASHRVPIAPRAVRFPKEVAVRQARPRGVQHVQPQ